MEPRSARRDAAFEVSVAPMEGFTTFPMRLWLWLAATPASMTTPFLRVTQAAPGRDLPALYAPELDTLRGVLPYRLTPQLLGGDVEQLLRAIDLLPPELAPVVELNCGCPSPNASGKAAGSGLLREAAVFGATVERLARALGPGRLAVKMRLGFASPGELPALLDAIEGAPLARLTVHGRTRADGYRGAARWDAIESAARRMGVPTWASGDVVDLGSLDAMRRAAPSTSGVMVGRGLFKNPWVFAELARGEPVRPEPRTRALALYVYALLAELATAAPEKLLARVANGRLASPCGTDPDAWERLAAQLSSVLAGAPRLPYGGDAAALPVSPSTVGRVRFFCEGRAARRARRLQDLLDLVLEPAPS